MNQWNKMSVAQIKETLAGLEEAQQSEVCDILLQDERKGVIALTNKMLRQIEKNAAEKQRLVELWNYEKEAIRKGYTCIIGTDEVGRGPLAGPVVAAAVVLPENCMLAGINDSKKLSEKKREALAEEIKNNAIAYAIKEVSPEDIDRLNILRAAEKAMEMAVKALNIGDYVLIDGDNRPRFEQPSQNIIKGDAKSISIASASIIAKVYRDNLMVDYDEIYPEYGFGKHKGYGTAEHYNALKQYGPSPIHRRSFRLE